MEKLIAKVNALLGKLYPTWLVGKVAEDKFMHIVCGFIITAVLTPFIGAYSIVVVAIIALLKEIYDYLHKDIHTPDFLDWVATTLGGVLGTVIVSLI